MYLALQQLNQIQTTTDSAALARFSGPLGVSVALLNAVLWISFVAFAFVQVTSTLLYSMCQAQLSFACYPLQCV